MAACWASFILPAISGSVACQSFGAASFEVLGGAIFAEVRCGLTIAVVLCRRAQLWLLPLLMLAINGERKGNLRPYSCLLLEFCYVSETKRALMWPTVEGSTVISQVACKHRCPALLLRQASFAALCS